MTTRSVARRALGWLVGTVILVLLGFLAGRLYAVRRLEAAREAFTQDIGPAKLSAWASPRVPEAENAAVPIRSGALRLVLSPGDRTFVGELAHSAPEPWTPEQIARLRRIVTENAAALELLRKGAGLPRSSFDVTPRAGAEPGDRIPLIGIITAARLLRAETRLARLDGDREAMLVALGTLSGLARAVHQDPQLTSQLMAHAAERLLLGALTEVATASETTVDELQRMQGMLLVNNLGAAWRRTSGVDFAENLAAMESALARAPREPEPGLVERAMSSIVEPLFEAQSLEAAVELAALLDRPLGLHWPELQARWVQVRVTSLNAFRMMRAPSLVRAAGRFQATESQRRLVSLGLALRDRGLTLGSYPSDLSGFPEAGRPDPFSGQPFSYERRPDGSVLLAVPDGDSLWKQVTGGMPEPCPFSWILPPPALSPAVRGGA